MERIDAIVLEGPPLTKPEKLEIFRLQRLFATAPAELQDKAIARINPLLETGRVDSRHLMTVVRAVSDYLRDALGSSDSDTSSG